MTSLWLSNHLKDISPTEESDGARSHDQRFEHLMSATSRGTFYWFGANKRTWIRTCRGMSGQRQHITICHHIWHRCGCRTIWKTYPRPKNRMVQKAATKDSDTWCQRHCAERSICVIWCHNDVIWRHCEYHNITTTSDNCPCTVLHIRNAILWWACVSYPCVFV